MSLRIDSNLSSGLAFGRSGIRKSGLATSWSGLRANKGGRFLGSQDRLSLTSSAQAKNLAQAIKNQGSKLGIASWANSDKVGFSDEEVAMIEQLFAAGVLGGAALDSLSGASVDTVDVSSRLHRIDDSASVTIDTSGGSSIVANPDVTQAVAGSDNTAATALAELQEFRTAMKQDGLFQRTTDDQGNVQVVFNRGAISDKLQAKFSNIIGSVDQFLSDINTDLTADEAEAAVTAFFNNIGKFVDTAISVVTADHNDVESSPNAPQVPSYDAGDLSDTRSFLTATRGVLFRSGNPDAFDEFLDAAKTVADRATATGNNDMVSSFLQHFGTFERDMNGTVGGTTFAANFGNFVENSALGALIPEFAAVTERAATNLTAEAFVNFQNAMVGLSGNVANPDAAALGGVASQRMAEFLGRAGSMIDDVQDRTQVVHFTQTATSLSGGGMGSAFDEFLNAVDAVRALDPSSSAGLEQFLNATDAVAATGSLQNMADFLAKAEALATERPDELTAFLEGVINGAGALPASNTIAHGVDQETTPLTIEDQMSIVTPGGLALVATDAAAGTISIDFGVAGAGYGVAGGAVGTEFDVIATEHAGGTQTADVSFDVSYSAWMADVDLSVVTGVGAVYSAGAAAVKEGVKATARAVVKELAKESAKAMGGAILQEGVTAVGTAIATTAMNDLYSDTTDDLDFNGFVMNAYLVDSTTGEVVSSMTVAEGKVNSILGNGEMDKSSGDEPDTFTFEGVELEEGHTYQVVLVAEMGGVAVGAAGGTAGGVDATLSNVSVDYQNDASTAPLVDLEETPNTITTPSLPDNAPADGSRDTSDDPSGATGGVAGTAGEVQDTVASSASLAQQVADKAKAYAQEQARLQAAQAQQQLQQLPDSVREQLAAAQAGLGGGRLTNAASADGQRTAGVRQGIANFGGLRSVSQTRVGSMRQNGTGLDPSRDGRLAAESRIRDADMAAENANLAQLAPLQAVAGLATANVDRARVLQLLQ